MNEIDNLEIKQLLSKLLIEINLLIPNKMSVGYIAEVSTMSRQSIHQFLLNNFQEDIDFWKEGSKTFVTKSVGINLLQRSNAKKMAV